MSVRVVARARVDLSSKLGFGGTLKELWGTYRGSTQYLYETVSYEMNGNEPISARIGNDSERSRSSANTIPTSRPLIDRYSHEPASVRTTCLTRVAVVVVVCS